jgi:hypothetical protein
MPLEIQLVSTAARIDCDAPENTGTFVNWKYFGRPPCRMDG